MNNGTIKVKGIIDNTTFYKKLPPKTCVDCGYKIEEQHESYLTKCDHCLSKEIE
ncbi:protein YhfH [Metabacillus rhizolycopersici]|uniref:YhfH family protein n=1 Tax=Metabacillus rhizolycopersici TaxID=2875709 RepID=A0ABS7UY77_9BACI|nr:protein YhfH [Metabacillus rhizolycopersici]MBZ5752969.1 YhfH family protein [Metabacillus rhizolycopersici]